MSVRDPQRNRDADHGFLMGFLTAVLIGVVVALVVIGQGSRDLDKAVQDSNDSCAMTLSCQDR